MKIKLSTLKNIIRETSSGGEYYYPHPLEDAIDEWISGFSPKDVVKDTLYELGSSEENVRYVMDMINGMEEADHFNDSEAWDDIARELKDFLQQRFHVTLSAEMLQKP